MALHDLAHGHSALSSPLLPTAQTENDSCRDASDIFPAELSPSRQQKLLQSRNARFPAKKLSISGLSSKLTQLIGNNDHADGAVSPTRNQENKLHKSRSTGTIGRRTGLGILDEISNSTKARSGRRQPEVLIYEDNPSRPLLQTSPLAGSSPCADTKIDCTSPLNFDHIQDSLNTMRVRNVSLNSSLSPVCRSPTSVRQKQNRRAFQVRFDAEEYIEHIEKELQQVRDEAYSPLTRRPMKEKLRAANKENERLQKELASIREKFETELKRTVEHKTIQEVELKRRVRDLEESLEDKENMIRDLQYQHEERRLDTTIIETLKAQIDKLEQDKSDMEEINLSMNKRNEVLTQLLAMSPTKTATAFSTNSPTKEKRNARPMSLILPKIQSSPKLTSQGASVAGSPGVLRSAEISPLKLSPESQDDYFKQQSLHQQAQSTESTTSRAIRSPILQDGPSRRWTMMSNNSLSTNHAVEDARPSRKKARKFVAGSTQLKPLLLSALTGDSLASASTVSSPRSWSGSSCFEVEEDQTMLPVEEVTDESHEISTSDTTQAWQSQLITDVNGPGPAFEQEFNEDTRIFMEASQDLPPQSHLICSSLQTMPMPSTPESLVALPEPLFSPVRQNRTNDESITKCMLSGSPTTPPYAHINMRKRRQLSVDRSSLGSPRAKIQCSQARPPAIHRASNPGTLRKAHDSRRRHSPSRPSIFPQGLHNARSTDNVAEILRRKDFAVKPLASMTIRTVYKILATCTSVVHDFRKDPFALARRVLANAWYMNWNMLGQLSWWVLGLFVHPQRSLRAHPSVDWERYDGESIASRYCNDSSEEDITTATEVGCALQNGTSLEKKDTGLTHSSRQAEPRQKHTGWAGSLFLWGKFSAVMMLAVTGAFIKGPGEILKDIRRKSTGNKSCKSCSDRQVLHSSLPRDHESARQSRIFESGQFDFRSETQLDSSSILDQIQQPALYDSTLRPRESPRKRIASLFSPNDPRTTSSLQTG